ncbi:MAG: hypothetical protein H7844_01375 [Nitrospirae bacterium YQR-1]
MEQEINIKNTNTNKHIALFEKLLSASSNNYDTAAKTQSRLLLASLITSATK